MNSHIDEIEVAVAQAAARARTEALTGTGDGLVVHRIEWLPPGTPPARRASGFYDRSPLDRSLPYLVVLATVAATYGAVIAAVGALR